MFVKYLLILVLFIFVFSVIFNLPKISNKIYLLKLDEIRIKINLAKKFKKAYKIDQIDNIKIKNKTLCIKNECINISKNISIKGGTIYV